MQVRLQMRDSLTNHSLAVVAQKVLFCFNSLLSRDREGAVG